MRDKSGFGKPVILSHPDGGVTTRYYHLSRFARDRAGKRSSKESDGSRIDGPVYGPICISSQKNAPS